MRKSDQSRPFPPDFVSAETLAYRLDCAERTVQDYVKAGLLPHPLKIGNLVRWHWPDVQAHIQAVNGADNAGQDEYSAGLHKIREKAGDRAA